MSILSASGNLLPDSASNPNGSLLTLCLPPNELERYETCSLARQLRRREAMTRATYASPATLTSTSGWRGNVRSKRCCCLVQSRALKREFQRKNFVPSSL